MWQKAWDSKENETPHPSRSSRFRMGCFWFYRTLVTKAVRDSTVSPSVLERE